MQAKKSIWRGAWGLAAAEAARAGVSWASGTKHTSEDEGGGEHCDESGDEDLLGFAFETHHAALCTHRDAACSVSDHHRTTPIHHTAGIGPEVGNNLPCPERVVQGLPRHSSIRQQSKQHWNNEGTGHARLRFLSVC